MTKRRFERFERFEPLPPQALSDPSSLHLGVIVPASPSTCTS
ncbi:hypothetical protein BofuT4_uP131680.1 [Botrytis cinerea T4]|uniref:Uncharacterized protein n=1 Tax=Botryotinia fuckeliana (strain T4) TaxID=999810 RepID=G2YQU0_BOTF4|nr:hypothetical protein BofuT4_uP131680.1 [Botrytis cinerea T4]